MKHYVIGDVHGHHDTLMRLIAKLPNDAKLIFVGDLIDRGDGSAKVVRFVRDGGHLCVMGNHEELMVKDLSDILDACENDKELDLYSMWLMNGGVQTLLSYGIISLIEGKPAKVKNLQKAIKQIRSDLEWIVSLPLYIKLEISHPSGKPVVVSHACIGNVWKFHKDEKNQITFKEYALWNRKPEPKIMSIFNIFGHTPIRWGVDVQSHYVNVDTGCYRDEDGYNQLSAYCIESGEVVSQEYVHRFRDGNLSS